MEPITTLAAATIAILTPFLTKSAEEFAKTAGKEAFEQSKKLYEYVKGKLSGNKDAAAVLELYEKKPARHESALTEVLVDEMTENEAFAQGLSTHVQYVGPLVHVIQEMNVAEHVVGVHADQLDRGKVEVLQKIGTGKSVVGVRIGKKGE